MAALFARTEPPAEPLVIEDPFPATPLERPCAAPGPTCEAILSDARNGTPVSVPVWTPDSLDADAACSGKGYLCADALSLGEVRVLRWPEEQRVLRVRVTRPPGVPTAQGDELRLAATRGILSWQGVPMDFVILGERETGPADVVVRWVERLPGTAVGQTRVEWERLGTHISFTVQSLVLALRSPVDPGIELSLDQIRLAAAHEMGHALGLPHSDDPTDVMYPENRARRLSVADYRTVQGLYELPNGATIRLRPST